MARERARGAAHQPIVPQFPIYWRSTPALLKRRFDGILARGMGLWAGRRGLGWPLIGPAYSSGGPADS